MTTPHFPAAHHRPDLIGQLRAGDFELLAIDFPDGSQWITDALIRRENGYVVVYTEHSGYHVFCEHPEDLIRWRAATPEEAKAQHERLFANLERSEGSR